MVGSDRFLHTRAHVLPPKKRLGKTSNAMVVRVHCQQSCWHVNVNGDRLYELWQKVFRVLDSPLRRGSAANDQPWTKHHDEAESLMTAAVYGCDSCGLCHSELLAVNDAAPYKLLVRPPPATSSVMMSSPQLRATTYTSFLSEVISVMRTLESQRALLAKCQQLDMLYLTLVDLLGLDSAKVTPVLPLPPFGQQVDGMPLDRPNDNGGAAEQVQPAYGCVLHAPQLAVVRMDHQPSQAQ